MSERSALGGLSEAQGGPHAPPVCPFHPRLSDRPPTLTNPRHHSQPLATDAAAANRRALADGGPSKPGPALSGAPGEAEEQEEGKFDAILAEDTSTMRALRDGKVGSTAAGRFTCAAPQALRNQLSRALVFPGAAEEFCAGLSPLLEETTVLLAALVPFVSRGAAGGAAGAIGGGGMEATSLIKTLLKVRAWLHGCTHRR